MSGIVVDLGTGDGSFVFALAKKYPKRLIIGIDPVHKNLIEVSRKVQKKPSKGGLANTLFVLANGLDLPEELTGIADQVYINFPWGSLLIGIITADKKLWENIKSICKLGAVVDLIVGYDKTMETKEVKNLADLNLNFFQNDWLPKLREFGFEKVAVEPLSSKVLKNYPSTWAKKLGFGKPRNFYYIRLKLISRQ
jgi:16S rRNA (adenine(1408)-N(1))-methyltransferase